MSFFGDGPAGDLYLLFISLGKTNSPQTAPGIIGGVHLNLNVAAFLGLYVPQGPTTSYHTLTMPSVPAAMGVTFYDQALALHANGTAETTVLDCYQF